MMELKRLSGKQRLWWTKHTLVALMLLCAMMLGSCSVIVPPQKQNDSTGQETSRQENTVSHLDPDDTDAMLAAAQTALDQLPHTDMGGNFVTIASVNPETVSPIYSASAMDEYRLTRNSMLEAAFNCTVMVVDYEVDELFDELSELKRNDNGTNPADFYMIPQKYVGEFVQAGLLGNLRTLPYVDFDAPYFDQAAMDNTAAANTYYAAIGDFTYAPEYTYGVYYNKALLASLTDRTMASLNSDGTWTWETFTALSNQACNTLGVAGFFMDRYSDEEMVDLVTASAGIHAVGAKTDITPTTLTDTAQLDMICHAVKNAIGDVTSRGESNDQNPLDLFLQGKSLFYIGPLLGMETLSKNTGFSWGMMPLPKASESQSTYYSYANDDMPLLCISSDAENSDTTGMLLGAMFCSSWNYFQEFYSHYTMNTLVSDNLSAVSVDKITQGIFYDFYLMYYSGYPALNNTYHTGFSWGGRMGGGVFPGDIDLSAASYCLNVYFHARNP